MRWVSPASQGVFSARSSLECVEHRKANGWLVQSTTITNHRIRDWEVAPGQPCSRPALHCPGNPEHLLGAAWAHPGRQWLTQGPVLEALEPHFLPLTDNSTQEEKCLRLWPAPLRRVGVLRDRTSAFALCLLFSISHLYPPSLALQPPFKSLPEWLRPPSLSLALWHTGPPPTEAHSTHGSSHLGSAPPSKYVNLQNCAHMHFNHSLWMT